MTITFFFFMLKVWMEDIKEIVFTISGSLLIDLPLAIVIAGVIWKREHFH